MSRDYRALAVSALALALAGCGTVSRPMTVTEAAIASVPKEVAMPIAVSCHPDIGPEPIYPDTDAALRAGPKLIDRVKLLLEGRIMRIQRDREKQAALDECRAGVSGDKP